MTIETFGRSGPGIPRISTMALQNRFHVPAQQDSGSPPLTPTPLVTPPPPFALPESLPDVDLDISSRAAPPDDPPAPAEPKTTTTVVSRQPDGVMIASSVDRRTADPDAVAEQPRSESASEPRETSGAIIEKAPESLAMAAADDSQPAGIATITADSTPRARAVLES